MTPDQAAQHFTRREADSRRFTALSDHIRSLWGGACSVRRCGGCGLRYADPFVAGDSRFYDLAYPVKGVYPEHKWDFDRTFLSMESEVSASGGGAKGKSPRLMEIGAGHGGFVRSLVARKLVAAENIVCTEYDPVGVAGIRAAGIRVIVGDFRSLSPDDLGGRFDAVCMFQVLEHLDHLQEVFAACDRFLSPDGAIYLTVPNAAHIAFNEKYGALLDMPPNHVSCWTLPALEHLALHNGFAVTETDMEPFRVIADTRLFLTYRFLRRSHIPGTVANRISRISNRRVLKSAGALWALFDALRGTAAVGALWRERPGRSLWIKLRRQGVQGTGCDYGLVSAATQWPQRGA